MTRTRLFAISALVLLLLASSALAAAFLSAQVEAQARKIGIVTAHGQVGRTKRTSVFGSFVGNLTQWGFEFVLIEAEITPAALAGIDFLLMGSVFGKNLTDAEIAAIGDWFNQGGKTLWVGSDSDFGKGHYIIENSNRVLEAVKSRIRAEPTQVLDPVSNAGADYRVVAPIINTDPAVSEITAGVKKLLFHGPTILAGVKDGKWVPLETEAVENVFWIAKTSPDSRIVDQDIIMPKAHENGQKGSFVVLAVEKFAGPRGDGKIIVGGNDAYGDYEPIFQWKYYGVDLDGPLLVKNMVTWGLKVERAPTFLEQNLPIIIGIVAVIIVAAVAAILLRRRRPKAA